MKQWYQLRIGNGKPQGMITTSKVAYYYATEISKQTGKAVEIIRRPAPYKEKVIIGG